VIAKRLKILEPWDPFTRASDKQIRFLKILLAKYDIEEEWVCSQCDVQKLEELLKDEAWIITLTLAD